MLKHKWLSIFITFQINNGVFLSLCLVLQMLVRIAFWKYPAYHEAEMDFGWIQLEWFGDKRNYQKTR